MAKTLKDWPPLLTQQRDFSPLAGDASQDTYADSTVMDLTQPVAPAPTPVTAPASTPTISSISTAIDSDGHAHVDLAWAAIDGAATYEVRYKLTSESLYTYVTTATASIRISNLLPATSYDFGVQAVGSGGVTSGYGSDTTQVTAADSTAPADVAGFAVSAGLKSVVASWTPNADADLKDYKVEVATDAGFTSIVQTTYLLATVFAYQGAAATTYYVRVKARDTSGNLSASFASGNATTAQVVTGDVVPAAITTALIANAAITNALIANNAVDSAQIAANAVTNAKIVDDAIDAAKIAAGAVGTTELDALAVTTAKIAALAVDTAQIAAAAITGAKIAANTITAGNILAGTITATEIAANTITAAKIAAGTITTTEIAALTIVAANIAAGTITGAKIAANTIAAANIVAGTITATEIAAATITGAKIAAATIAAGNIVANTITAGQIAAGTITANEIAALTIVAANIAANTITGGKLVAGTITATQIAAGTITADRMVAATIDAASGILADAVITTAKIAALAVTDAKINDLAVGKLTAGTLSAAVILSGSIKTATTGARVEIDGSGVRLYDSGGTAVVNLNASTGSGTFAGTITGSSFWIPDQAYGTHVVSEFGVTNITSFQVADHFWAMWPDGETAPTVSNPVNVVALHADTPGGNNYVGLESIATDSGTSKAYSAHQQTTTLFVNSGYPAFPLSEGALTASEVASLSIDFQHWNGTSQIQSLVYLGPVNTAGDVEFYGVMLMPQLYRARGFVQSNGSSFAGNGTPQIGVSVTYPTAFSADTERVQATANNLATGLALFCWTSSTHNASSCQIVIRNQANANWTNTVHVNYAAFNTNN